MKFKRHLKQMILITFFIFSNLFTKANNLSMLNMIDSILGMKSKNSKHMQSFQSISNKVLQNSNNQNLNSEVVQDEVQRQLLKDNSPTYFQSWVKYFHYTIKTEKPNSFFVNDLYSSQSKLYKRNKNLGDENGSILIPDSTSFFAIVQDDKVNILASRSSNLDAVVDVMSIQLIDTIPDDNITKGGVKNYGLFKEGFCFKVITYVPNRFYEMSFNQPSPKNSIPEYWVFCLELQSDKDKMMSWIIKQKLRLQANIGFHQSQSNIISRELSIHNQTNDPKVLLSGFNKIKKDGYWEIIKNWGECSLACGGGEQIQQLICVLPLNGGKMCLGDSIP